MQRLRALKSFPLAADGVRVRLVEAGEEFTCSDGAAAGLVAEELACECEEAKKESREPIANKDAGDPDGAPKRSRARRSNKGS